MPQQTSIIVMSRPGIGGAQSPEVTSSPSSHAGSMSSPAASCAVRRIATSPSSKRAFPALPAARVGRMSVRTTEAELPSNGESPQFRI
jgi:hypothetical protein